MIKLPRQNQAYIFNVSLVSLDTGRILASPTLAAGDVKVSIDNGTPANLATLPVVTPANSGIVKVSLAAAETNGLRISVLFADVLGDEWADLHMAFQTTTADLDSLNTLLVAIKAKTDQLAFTQANVVDANALQVTDKLGYSLSTGALDGILRTALVESYAAPTIVPTLSQAVFMLLQSINDIEASGTSLSVKRRNGTEAFQVNLNSAATPTTRRQGT